MDTTSSFRKVKYYCIDQVAEKGAEMMRILNERCLNGIPILLYWIYLYYGWQNNQFYEQRKDLNRMKKDILTSIAGTI